MAKRKALVYVRKDGSKVAVDGKPVHGQLRFVAAKRTAIDGKVWWCIFDNEKNGYVRGSKYKMKLECEAAITRKLQTRELDFVPYDDGTFKKGKHGFEVTVSWTVAKTYEVEAESREEARTKIQAMVDRGEVCVWSDGFEATDDVEVKVVGEEKKDGEIQYL